MKKTISFGLGIAFALLPLAASAQSADTAAQITALTAQLSQLQALIAQLKGQTTVTTPTTPALSLIGTSACPTPLPTRDLTQGATGVDVAALQSFLIGQGYLESSKTTGFFGPLTEAAVQKFQVAHNLVTSGTPSTTGYGFVGTKTRAMINVVCNPGYANPAPTPVPAPTPAPVYIPAPAPQQPVSSNAYISYFNVSPSSISAGQQATINRSVQNAGGCVLSQQVQGQPSVVINSFLPFNGPIYVAPAKSTVYTLACTSIGAQGNGAVQTASVTVYGATTSANPTTTTHTPAVIATFTANPTSSTANQPVALHWTTQNAASCTLSKQNPAGTVVLNTSLQLQGETSVAPETSNDYIISCLPIDPLGASASQSVHVTVN